MLILTSIFYIIDQPSTVEQTRSASALECPIWTFAAAGFPVSFLLRINFAVGLQISSLKLTTLF